MSHFEKCVEFVLEREGGYSIHPRDRGGATNFGITQATLSLFRGTQVTSMDVYKLSVSEAKEIYRRFYWTAMCLERIASWRVALILFDQGVNRGHVGAIRMLQEVLNIHFGENLKIDGLFGIRTELAVKIANEELLCRKLIQAAQKRYAQISYLHPDQSVFLVGWLSRTFALWDAIAFANENVQVQSPLAL